MTHKSRLAPHAVGWLVILAGTLAAPWADATVGGSPTDPHSCYSDCDMIGLVGGQKCYCDSACEQLGDCCADKHEYCAPTRAKPICALVDDTKTPLASQVCGADLGATFVHRNRIEIIFGDSFEYRDVWASGGDSCVDHGYPWEGRSFVFLDFNDDSQARFANNLQRPSWVPQSISEYDPGQTNCRALAGGTQVLQFDPKPIGGTAYTYQQLRLEGMLGENISLGVLNTPLGAFSDGRSAYAFFVAQPPSEDSQPGCGLGECKHVYLTKRRGETTTLLRTQYDAIADLGRTIHTGGTTRFLNNTSARVTSLAGAIPGVNPTPLNNFQLPVDPADGSASAGGDVLVWGRPDFKLKEEQASNLNPVYLMRLRLTAGTNGGLGPSFSPWYFGGLALNLEPMWTQQAANAVPVITEDFRVSSQFDVKWIPQLGKWVMLYGGDVAEYMAPPDLDPPTTMDQPRHGAIHMRTADFPWGPWSRPTPLLWREAMGHYFQCDSRPNTNPPGCDAATYPTGDWEQGSMTQFQGFQGTGDACQTSHPKPALELNLLCPWQSMRGTLYAPNMIPSWTETSPAPPGGLGRTTIYFTVSTFYPYNVVLAAADLAHPNNRYPLKTQLRHALTRKMIGTTTAATPAPTMTKTAGGFNGGSVAFLVSKVASGDRPRNRDIVVVRNPSTGNRYLTRDGTALKYVQIADGNPVPLDAQWELKHALNAPLGAEIVPNDTVFYLRSVGAGDQDQKYLGWSGAGAPTVTGNPGLNHVWRFTYSCRTDDPDGPVEADECN
jgi:hypothetical protein